VSLSNQGKEDEAIEWYNRALEKNPDDYNSLRQMGVSLSEQGKEDEAIEWYNRALEKNPEDYRSLRQMGVSLSNQGKEDEAIEWYNRALEKNPEDYHSLRSLGVSLSNQGKQDEAIEWFKKALKKKPEDYRSLREWSVAAFKSRDKDTALDKIKEAYRLEPTNKGLLNDIKFVCSATDTDVNKVVREITAGVMPEATEVTEIEKDVTDVKTLLYGMVKEKFKDKIEEFSKKKKESERRFEIFLANESRLRDDLSLLFVLRKWNSFTPAIPLKGEERRLGGGYFIWHKGKGTVIDPGYNFIENFSNAGCRLVNIDRIIITHAHNDHTDDFEAILNLFHEFNDKYTGKEKKVDIYMNMGSLMKFSGLINLKKCDYIHKVYPMSAGNIYSLADGMTITALPAYHNEVITDEYSLGVVLSIETDEGSRKIVLTSDTGLYPQVTNDRGEKVADTEGEEIYKLYRKVNEGILKDVSLLISHLGSIKKEEIEQPDSLTLYFYPNHLGVQGTVQMITAVRPKLAVVSEFGEELRGFRLELMDSIKEVITEFFDKKGEAPNIIPGDLPLIYDIEHEAVYCQASKEMVSCRNVGYKLWQKTDTFYYFAVDKCAMNDEDMKHYVEVFELERENVKELFCFRDLTVP
jgi:Tfp pilus assembly protein PilF/phosphoribosyl 1,2-cyclic phosphodiesterase